jgi:hypothetical protein
LGHIGRLRPLAESFIARGKSVAFAVRDVRFCSTIFQGTPIAWFQAPAKIGRPQHEIAEPRTFADILHNVGFGDVEELASLVMAWRNLIGLLRPKLVILEHSPTACLSARGIGAKTAVVGSGFSCPADTEPLMDLRPWLGGSPPREEEARILATINTVLDRLGLARLARVSQLYADADATELITFPELDPYGGRPGVRYWSEKTCMSMSGRFARSRSRALALTLASANTTVFSRGICSTNGMLRSVANARLKASSDG